MISLTGGYTSVYIWQYDPELIYCILDLQFWKLYHVVCKIWQIYDIDLMLWF